MKGPNLQDPYLRVTDIQFLLVCSRWCTSLLCQGAWEKKKNPRINKVCLQPFLASWAFIEHHLQTAAISFSLAFFF